MNNWSIAVVTLTMVVVAGCAGLLGGTASPTITASPSPSATPTPTPEPGERFPPGLTAAGIVNASALLDAHVTLLNQSGFVGVGNGNGTIIRRGFLIEVRSSQQNTVATNATRYHRNRTVTAGPVSEEREEWGNGTIAYRRVKENGDWSYSREEPAHVAVLAGRGLLMPYLEAGNYTLADSQVDNDVTRYRLIASEVDDTAALRDRLPDATEEIQSFEAAVVVDSEGRVYSLQVLVNYVIQGQEATHSLEYSLERVGGVSVDQPRWVREAADTTTDGQSSAHLAQPLGAGYGLTH